MTFTMSALSEAAQQPAERIVEFLESKKRERAVAMAATREGPGFTGEIDEVIRLANSSPGRVLAHIGQINMRLARDRASLTRHLAR